MSSLPQNLLNDPQQLAGANRARAETAYEHLRLLLLEGQLSPGDKLSVVEISEDLGCSRVPIMEAMKRLESDGFVHIVPQVGCSVVIPKASDVRDFFDLFAAVEGTVTAFAAERADNDDLETFKGICAQVEQEAGQAGGPNSRDPGYRRLNLLFHGCIHRMARAPVATTLAASLWDRSDFYIKVAFGSLYFSSPVRRAHRAIRKAILVGDGDAARKAVHAHLSAVGQRVARALDN